MQERLLLSVLLALTLLTGLVSTALAMRINDYRASAAESLGRKVLPTLDLDA